MVLSDMKPCVASVSFSSCLFSVEHIAFVCVSEDYLSGKSMEQEEQSSCSCRLTGAGEHWDIVKGL